MNRFIEKGCYTYKCYKLSLDEVYRSHSFGPCKNQLKMTILRINLLLISEEGDSKLSKLSEAKATKFYSPSGIILGGEKVNKYDDAILNYCIVLLINSQKSQQKYIYVSITLKWYLDCDLAFGRHVIRSAQCMRIYLISEDKCV